MDDVQDVLRLREHWHDLRQAVDTTNITVAVVQERQKGIAEQMTRIEGSVSICVDLLQRQNGRIGAVEQLSARLDERTPNGKAGGACGGGLGTLGGLIGGFLAGLLNPGAR